MRKLHSGTVCKLDESVGFGYVSDAAEQRRYIFNFEAVPARFGQRPSDIGLKLGARVNFEIDESGRVVGLKAVG